MGPTGDIEDRNAVVNGEFAKLPSDLTDGTIQMTEYEAANRIPISLKFKGAFCLSLTQCGRIER
jgi:hypothetical protein